jgi:acid phosphatase
MRQREVVSLLLSTVIAAVMAAPVAVSASFTSDVAGSLQATTSSAPHVMVIMEENRSYSQVIGSSSAPYINSLAAKYLLATRSYSLKHDSLPNYLALTSGGTQGCGSTTCGPFAAPDIAGELSAKGIAWRAYMEGMPSACSTVLNYGNYVRRHNPFVYFTDVLHNQCAQRVVPYSLSRLHTDLNSSAPPAFTWITPNLVDDMHSASVQAGDTWLKANLPTVLASSWYAQGGVVIITFDEGAAGDYSSMTSSTGGGGHIATLVISAKSRGHYTSPFNEYGILRAIQRAYAVSLLGGARNTANGDISAALQLI